MEQVENNYSGLKVSKGKMYGIYIGGIFMTILSMGFLYPLAIYLYRKYLINHQYIDGKKLEFKASIIRMFYTYLIGLNILLVTLIVIELLANVLPFSIPKALLNGAMTGLSAVFINVQLNIYIQKSTHFAGENDKKSYFLSKMWPMVRTLGLTALLNYISAGLLRPITHEISVHYKYNRAVIDNHKTKMTINIKKHYPMWFLRFLLVILTLGLITPYYINKEKIDMATRIHLNESWSAPKSE